MQASITGILKAFKTFDCQTSYLPFCWQAVSGTRGGSRIFRMLVKELERRRHERPRGVWGACSPRKFLIFEPQKHHLQHSEGSFKINLPHKMGHNYGKF